MSTERDDAIAASIQQDKEQKDFLGSVRLRSELAEAKARIRTLEHEVQVADARLGVALELDRPARKMPALPKLKGTAPRGAVVLLCSDWHVGERVDPGQVGGRNEYNPAIAAQRLDKLIEQFLWTIEAWRAGPEGYGWGIDQAVIWLGGDMMTGMIHEDLAESNFLSPTEEVLFAQELCLKLIDSVAAIKGINRIEVPTSWGNHGRTTPDRRVNTAWKQSYEWLMYQQIAKLYASSNKVRVHSGRDEITRIQVLNTRLGFNHGDQFRYLDGVGGLTIPGLKWLQKINATEPVDVMNIGHHHAYIDLGKLVVNNCMIGWGPFSQRVAPFSKPSQTTYLIDERFGKRMTMELVLA